MGSLKRVQAAEAAVESARRREDAARAELAEAYNRIEELTRERTELYTQIARLKTDALYLQRQSPTTCDPAKVQEALRRLHGG